MKSRPLPEQPPLHQVISEKLRQQIRDGQYGPGSQLPSESQLIEQFRVSRITVRQAIANLINQGLVTAYRGKGVFVNQQRKVTYSLSHPLVFFDQDMARQGVSSSIQNLLFERVSAPEDVQQALQLEEATEVYLQKKFLLIDRVPVALDITYILTSLGEQFASELQSHLTFPILEQHGISVCRITATVEITRASPELSELLEVPLGDSLLTYRYTAYSDRDQPIVWGETLSRGDRLAYSVVLSKQSS